MNLINKLEIKNNKLLINNISNISYNNVKPEQNIYDKDINKCGFNKKLINNFLNEFINMNCLINKMNNELQNNESSNNIKKIRKLNFPSEISENIVKYCIFNKYNIMPNWSTVKSGDLTLKLNTDTNNKNKEIKIEVKAFSSCGPISFGPHEYWDWIYFVDAINYSNKKFKIYELKLSSLDDKWLNININKTETFNDQKKQNRRPRIGFELLFNQLQKNNINIELIFDNEIQYL